MYICCTHDGRQVGRQNQLHPLLHPARISRNPSPKQRTKHTTKKRQREPHSFPVSSLLAAAAINTILTLLLLLLYYVTTAVRQRKATRTEKRALLILLLPTRYVAKKRALSYDTAAFAPATCKANRPPAQCSQHLQHTNTVYSRLGPPTKRRRQLKTNPNRRRPTDRLPAALLRL